MTRVALGSTQPIYCETPPFHPDVHFPELPFAEVSCDPNPAYALLRQLLRNLGLDAGAFSGPDWNPLGCLVRPGQRVVVKPNFVLDRNLAGQNVFAVVTHPSIIRAVIDYVFVALEGRGEIIVADAPQMDCQWKALMRIQRLDTVQEFYRSRFGFEIRMLDLRTFEVRDPAEPPYSSNRMPLSGDPEGSVVVNLGNHSSLHGLPDDKYYGADYNRQETIRHHSGGIHEYFLSRTVLSADTIISVPKMKVHKKVGMTGNVKGFVGVNTDKNALVHYRIGTPSAGGDQLPDGRPGADLVLVRLQQWCVDRLLARQTRLGDAVYRAALGLYRLLVKPVRRLSEETLRQDLGNWHGNDTAWRMTADLVRILFFADRHGTIQDTRQRNLFCVVDGIIGGEGDGPLAPTPRTAGCLLAGENPIAVDMVTARAMGFDVSRIHQFDLLSSRQRDFGLSGVNDIEIATETGITPGRKWFDPRRRDPSLHFVPHPGWRGHIEVSSESHVNVDTDVRASTPGTRA